MQTQNTEKNTNQNRVELWWIPFDLVALLLLNVEPVGERRDGERVTEPSSSAQRARVGLDQRRLSRLTYQRSGESRLRRRFHSSADGERKHREGYAAIRSDPERTGIIRDTP